MNCFSDGVECIICAEHITRTSVCQSTLIELSLDGRKTEDMKS